MKVCLAQNLNAFYNCHLAKYRTWLFGDCKGKYLAFIHIQIVVYTFVMECLLNGY